MPLWSSVCVFSGIIKVCYLECYLFMRIFSIKWLHQHNHTKKQENNLSINWTFIEAFPVKPQRKRTVFRAEEKVYVYIYVCMYRVCVFVCMHACRPVIFIGHFDSTLPVLSLNAWNRISSFQRFLKCALWITRYLQNAYILTYMCTYLQGHKDFWPTLCLTGLQYAGKEIDHFAQVENRTLTPT